MRPILAGLALALVIAAPVAAGHAGIGWASGDIRIATNVLGTDMEPYFRTAVSQWDASPRITLTVSEAKSCKPQRRMVVLCALPLSNQWARLDYQRGHLVSVYIQVPAFAHEALVGMVCHELGHGLGLFHTADTGSCLYSWEMDGVGGIQPPYPSAHDFEAIASLYRED